MSQTNPDAAESLSPWWRRGVIIILIFGFTVLIWLAARTYTDAPPIPGKVIDRSGATVFTRTDILAGQEVFLKYALMENGTIWGHGAYLGPDFSAAYLHDLSVEAGDLLSKQRSSGRDLREQYLLAYFSSNPRDGAWRSIRLDVKFPPNLLLSTKLIANYRRGYYGPTVSNR